MRKKHSLLLILAILLAALLACNISGNASPTPTQDQVATVVAATMISQLENTTPTPPTGLLPRPLYFRSDQGAGSFQVWRLETDGVTLKQITHENLEVSDYSVSSADGRVAYVVNNQLYLINADGSGRTLLIDGSAPNDSSEFYYRGNISGLAWSPSGNELAFGQNGVVLYNFVDGSIRRVIENEVEQIDNATLIPRNLYFPDSWSPDGTRLMVNIGWMEGGTLGVLNPANGAVVQMGNGIVCCQANWTQDSTGILVSSTVIGMIDSGLWRYDAVSGAETEMIPTTAEDDTLNFVGWVMQLPNGDLQYFFNNMPDFPQGETPLTLVRSAADGVGGRMQLRPEIWEVYEAIWAEDGSLVVAVQPPLGEDKNYPRRGPVVLIDTAGNPVMPLAPNAFDLQWGP